MVNKALFSSSSIYWSTPQDLFDRLDDEFHFDLDSAADSSNSKVVRYLGPGGLYEDCLTITWPGKTVWFNPPYSRGIYKFIEKAYIESLKNKTVVCLLPSRTGTRWWHAFVEGNVHAEKRFLKGRLKFGNSKNSAPFDSVIVIFHAQKIFQDYEQE